jgi:hypothetical protein
MRALLVALAFLGFCALGWWVIYLIAAQLLTAMTP